jgi:hypothetical protein
VWLEGGPKTWVVRGSIQGWRSVGVSQVEGERRGSVSMSPYCHRGCVSYAVGKRKGRPRRQSPPEGQRSVIRAPSIFFMGVSSQTPGLAALESRSGEKRGGVKL